MPKMIGMMRLGRDCELRYTPDNTPVASMSLAYSHGKAGQDGKRPTAWIDASMWGKRAESISQYLLKGGLHCFTLDEVHIQTFQRQDGTSGTKLVARVLDVELGSRQEGAAPAPAPRPAPAPAPRQAAPKSTGFEDMADDLDVPF